MQRLCINQTTFNNNQPFSCDTRASQSVCLCIIASDKSISVIMGYYRNNMIKSQRDINFYYIIFQFVIRRERSENVAARPCDVMFIFILRRPCVYLRLCVCVYGSFCADFEMHVSKYCGDAPNVGAHACMRYGLSNYRTPTHLTHPEMVAE
jgi:hypothetical protein